MPAFKLSWPKTGRPRICAAALEVLHPLKLLSPNIQIAFLAQPFPPPSLPPPSGRREGERREEGGREGDRQTDRQRVREGTGGRRGEGREGEILFII